MRYLRRLDVEALDYKLPYFFVYAFLTFGLQVRARYLEKVVEKRRLYILVILITLRGIETISR